MTKDDSLHPQAGGKLDCLIDGPAGALEARLSMPEDSAEPERVAVVCHPHPSHGGTMENKVAYTLARACNESGLAALRFNFRGTGQSEGRYDEGRGEVDDCLAAADWLCARFPDAALVLAGFSFGAYVSLVAAGRLRPACLISVAPPMSYFTVPPEPPPCPWFVVQGDADDVVDVTASLDMLRGLATPPRIEIMEGVGHFFHGQLTPLRKWVQQTLAESVQ